MNFPQMIRFRQRFPNPVLKYIPAEINSQFTRLDLGNTVEKGQRVAVACSSRGIANYNTIVKAVISSLKTLGLSLFIVPAMGSHGAAIAAGQKRVLEHIGINEKEVEAPIRSSLEVVNIGEAEDHIPERKNLEIAMPKRAMVFDQEGHLETF